MTDEELLLIGAWIDAIGTDISAIAEIRALAGRNGLNNKLVSIGEGLQAVGTFIIGTVTTDDRLNFSGNWIDGVGAATSSLAAYRQFTDEENGDENIQLEVIGDLFQSMGASVSSLADHLIGNADYALGNAIQALGAGLEAIGGVYELNERNETGQPITTSGAIFQSIGSNYNAFLATRDAIRDGTI